MKITILLSLTIAILYLTFDAPKTPDRRTTKTSATKRAPQWFVYIGAISPATVTSAKVAANYRMPTGSEIPSQLCNGSLYLCAIMAESDGTGKPVFSAQLLTDINNYFANPAAPPASIREKN